MRILLVNQFVPPDKAPTSRLLGELGTALEAAGHEIVFISGADNYRSTHARKGGRLLRELQAHWRILVRGMSAPRADLVIGFSSPPCLPVTAAIVALRHRAPTVHWAMDIYPEIALALGEIRPGLVSRITGFLMNRAYHHAKLVVALDEDMADVFAKKGVPARVLPPWIPTALDSAAIESAAITCPDANAFTWLYSGNLGRAHEWRTLLDAQALIEKEDDSVTLVFQGSGPSRDAARAYGESLQLQRCVWKDYAPEEELISSLAAAQVLVATQKPEAEGLLWPSKLALMSRLRRPLLWIGTGDSAIARMLLRRPGNAVFEPGNAAETAEWVLRRREEPLPLPKEQGNSPDLFDPPEGLRTWCSWIERLKAN